VQVSKGELMAIEETTKLKIKCDNPDCPGNELDPENRNGWLFVTHEVYGEPTAQHVFCSYACLGTASSEAPEANVMMAKPETPELPETPETP